MRPLRFSAFQSAHAGGAKCLERIKPGILVVVCFSGRPGILGPRNAAGAHPSSASTGAQSPLSSDLARPECREEDPLKPSPFWTLAHGGLALLSLHRESPSTCSGTASCPIREESGVSLRSSIRKEKKGKNHRAHEFVAVGGREGALGHS